MKLSIIIPYYNADKWIGGMLDSLMRQEMSQEEYEVIVVDDGSKETPITLKSYVQQYTNILYVHQENSGPGSARNLGIEKAKGEYLWFCDGDDYVRQNVIERLYNLAHLRNLDMLFFNVLRIEENVDSFNSRCNFDMIQEFETGKDLFALPINVYISMSPCQFIIAKSFITKNGLHFPSDMIMNEDACFLIDAILSSKKTAKVDIDAYFYIQHPNSLRFSGKVLQAEKWANNILQFISKLNTVVGNPELTNDMPVGCLNNLIWLKNDKSYIVLIGACKYMSRKLFRQIYLTLVEMNSYPKPYGNHLFIKKIILNRIILMTLNVFYGLKRKSVVK